jgi:hypothetical protein
MYDQMMAVYNRYRVLNTTVSITTVNDYSAGPGNPAVVCVPSNVNTPSSTLVLNSELPFS